MAKTVDIRKVNSFLRSNGIDPNKFRIAVSGRTPVLTRKNKALVESICIDGRRALVYLKGDRFVVRDADKKLPFEDPEFLKKNNFNSMREQREEVKA